MRGCSKIYLEHYTSVLGVDKAKLEEFYEREVGRLGGMLVASSTQLLLHPVARSFLPTAFSANRQPRTFTLKAWIRTLPCS